MLIIVADHLPESGWKALRSNAGLTVKGPFTAREAVLAALPEADALIIRAATIVDAELLDCAPRLKVIARAGARLNNIDIDEATARGIMVINVPAANIYAVVEHAFGMLLALARHTLEGARGLRSGRWMRHELIGFQLHGKALGIIGFGRLGRETAMRAQAFGMHVLVYDPNIDVSLVRAQGVEIVDFDELLRRADVIVPMTVPNGSTSPILNTAAFDLVKPSAVLVNVVHADLVDEKALLLALEAGKLAGAALDTFGVEPPDATNELIRHPRVLPAPHLNQNTIESQDLTGKQLIADVLDALNGTDYRNVVNLPFNQESPYTAVRPYIHLASKLGKLQGQLAEGWIKSVEVELLGEGLRNLIRPVAAVLLAGMLLPVSDHPVNWISAPVLAFEQGVITAQAKNLLTQADYPNLMICRIHWQGEDGQSGNRTVAGVLFANGEARLVQYDDFVVDAHPNGFVVILENDDVPGIIGKVGTQLGQAGINIANWRYGRETHGGRAVSFINVDSRVPASILRDLERNQEIHRARLVRL